MNGSREFDDILDECLDRILVKGETIEQCLASYPEQANELKPLLQAAIATREALAIHPRPEFRARARYQFRSALQEMEHKRSRLLFGWLPRWATALIMLIAILLAGGSTAAAASGSMPDDFLYPMKLATEQVWLTLTPSDIGKAEIYVKLADKRVAEIIYMANKGDAQQIEVITLRLDNHLIMLAKSASALKVEEAPKALAPLPALVPPWEETSGDGGVSVGANSRAKLRITLEHYAVNHPLALHAVLETAPESVKPALVKAIAISKAGYEKTLEALD